MSARQDDDRCIAQMLLTITRLQRRLEVVGVSREMFVHPQDAFESLVAEGVYHMVERALDEAANLSVDTMFEYRNIPWNKVIGLHNGMVHDYSGTEHDLLWDVISDDSTSLREMCEDYCGERKITSPRSREPPSGRHRMR